MNDLAKRWDRADQETKRLILETVGLDPLSYIEDPFDDLPEWAQTRIEDLEGEW